MFIIREKRRENCQKSKMKPRIGMVFQIHNLQSEKGVFMKQLSVISLLALLCLCGCEGFRFAATEAQKENAWLHERVCAAAADTAAGENVSPLSASV